METYSTEAYELTEERYLSVIREQGRRLDAQKRELASLNALKKRDTKNTQIGDAFMFAFSVLFDKAKLW